MNEHNTFGKRARLTRIVTSPTSLFFPLGLSFRFWDHWNETAGRTFAHLPVGECVYCQPGCGRRPQALGWASPHNDPNVDFHLVIVAWNAVEQLATQLDVTQAFGAVFRRKANTKYRPLTVERCRQLTVNGLGETRESAESVALRRIGSILYPSDPGCEVETWHSVFLRIAKKPGFSSMV